MPRPLLYSALMLMVAAARVANGCYEPSVPLIEPPLSDHEIRLANCREAIVAARRSPYWRNQAFTVDCRQTPGGWRLMASTTKSKDSCELYVGRDRLIVPRLPCQGVGEREDDLQ